MKMKRLCVLAVLLTSSLAGAANNSASKSEDQYYADAVLSVNKKIIKIVSLPRLYCKTKKYFQLTSCIADTDYSYVDK